jgi:hypothetical protein
MTTIGFASTDWSRSLFDKNKMNVPGGANWVRLQQLRPYLKFPSATGWLTWNDSFGFGISNTAGDVAHNLDVIVMQRIMFGNLVDKLTEYRERENRALIINDLDDWYWGLDPRNAAYKLTRPENNPDENIDHYKSILELSDVVTVSTPFLKRAVEQLCGHKNVVVIENHVSVESFNVRQFTGKQPVIGWVGSTNHRSGDLEELFGIFDNSYKFHHAGHYGYGHPFADAIGVKRERVAKSPMRPPWDYAKMSFCFDIGLAPLSDIEFNHAKSWIKAIEYCAAGVPFIASPRTEYLRLVELLGVGRIAHTPADWIAHVKELSDTSTRVNEAKMLRSKVTELLHVEHMARKWEHVISSNL